MQDHRTSNDPHHLCIHHLFQEQVARSPEATALVFEGETLTYGELNIRANRLAHRLIALGVRPDQRVAICVERSPAMVVGLMAILKAGRAYVPINLYHFYAADRMRTRLPQVDMVGGWRELLPDLAIRSVSIPGTHVSMMEDISHRKHLGEAFSRALFVMGRA
jgi:thioesterase domain-containing protein